MCVRETWLSHGQIILHIIFILSSLHLPPAPQCVCVCVCVCKCVCVCVCMCVCLYVCQAGQEQMEETRGMNCVCVCA